MPRIILDVKLYALQEVADILGVSRQTISKYIREGRLDAKTIGAAKYVAEDALRLFLKGDV